MSKITLEPNNSGTGTFTIAAPNSNTNRTLNLPDEAGTALTDATDLEPQVKTSLNATGDAPLFACRAWANFNSSSGIVIRDSGNISSISDLATGLFRVNFATDMPDNDYAVVFGGANRADESSNGSVMQIHFEGGGDVLDGQGNFTFFDSSGFDMNMKAVSGPELRDTSLATFAIFR